MVGMRLAIAPRASTILYNLLISRDDRRPFLLPANICPIVPITFFKAGVPFEFLDISPGTLHMDLEAAQDLLATGKYGGLLYAHTYGEPSTPRDFFGEAKRRDASLLLIDDRCLCNPDLEPDAASQADVILYSTGYAKIVELNYGGYAFFRDTLPYQPAHLSYAPGALETLESGYKSAISKRQLYHYVDSPWLETDADLPDWDAYCAQIRTGLPVSLAHRREINAIYTSRLPQMLQLPAAYQRWRFNLRVLPQQRAALLEVLFAAGLFASAHYASLAGIMSAGSCPQAEKLAEGVINLFNDSHYTPAMAEKTCDIFLKTLSMDAHA